jgi:hypothetical protein
MAILRNARQILAGRLKNDVSRETFNRSVMRFRVFHVKRSLNETGRLGLFHVKHYLRWGRFT